jgi:hypothetical protein
LNEQNDASHSNFYEKSVYFLDNNQFCRTEFLPVLNPFFQSSQTKSSSGADSKTRPIKNNSFERRVDRVPGFLSSRQNWVPPPPHLQASVVPPPPPPFGSGGTHSIAGAGVGVPNSDEGTDTVAF